MKNKTLYHGKRRMAFIDEDGAPIPDSIVEVDEVLTKTDRNGFEITYLTYLFDLFDKLGGKKYTVLKYIMSNKNADNQLIITTKELALKTGVSKVTVIEALKLLKEANLIETRTGAIMLNPKLSHRGSFEKEKYLLHKFVTFEEDI